jgi:hypothetical protein
MGEAGGQCSVANIHAGCGEFRKVAISEPK